MRRANPELKGDPFHSVLTMQYLVFLKLQENKGREKRQPVKQLGQFLGKVTLKIGFYSIVFFKDSCIF